MGVGTTAAAIFWGSVAAGGVIAGSQYLQSREQTKAAESQAKKQRAFQEEQELKAGEYFGELSREQMELQTQQSTIETLSSLLAARDQQPPQVFTLPPAKTESAIDRINRAIDDLFRGNTYG